MRKILYGGLSAALLLGGAAFAADAPTTQQNQDTSGAAAGQAGDTTQSNTHAVGPDKVITNPSAPDRASPMEQKGTAEAPDAMANPAGQNSIQGTIAKVHKHKLSVTDPSGQKQDFYVDHSSAVLRDGKTVSLRKLKKGDDVRVSYDLKNGKEVATTITATSKDAANSGTSDQPGQASPGHNPSGSSIQQPVPVGAPPTGENTQPDSSLHDRSFNGNTPGTNYKKESGDQNANTHNAGVNGNIGVQPQGDQQGNDAYGRGVNPKEGVKQGQDQPAPQQDQTQP